MGEPEKWNETSRVLPREGQLVMTKIDDHLGKRNEQPLSRSGRLWFSGNMYVYYTPTHWRPL